MTKRIEGIMEQPLTLEWLADGESMLIETSLIDKLEYT